MRVVVPKEVVPAELVLRLVAEPPTVRLPAAVTEASPVAAMKASRLPAAATVTSTPANEVAPKKELPGFVRVMSPVVEVIEEGAPVVSAPVCVISPTEVVVRPPVRVVAPKDVVPPELVLRLVAVPPTMRLPAAETEALPVAAIKASRLPAAATETSWPENEVAPKNELPALSRMMSPVDEVIVDGAPVVIAPVWVMSPTESALSAPVTVVTPKDVVPAELVLRSPVTEPAKLRSPSVATRLVAPKNELPALSRMMSPVLEVIVDGAPVVIAPVWVMSPTESAVSAPVRVVTPKDVVPAELVLRLVAEPPTVRLPADVTEASPVAAIKASRSPTAATVTSTPESVVAPKNELFGFVRVISPVVEVIEEGAPVVMAPVWVMSPTEVVFRPPVSVVAPKDVDPPELVARLTADPPTMRLPTAVTEASPVAAIKASRSPTAATETSTPESVVTPKNALSGFVSTMSPVLEVIEDGAPVMIAPVWVMSPTEVAVSAPVSVVAAKDVVPVEMVLRLVAEPPTIRLPAAVTEASPVAAMSVSRSPDATMAISAPVIEVAPKNELSGFVSTTLPVAEAIEEAAPVVMAPVWVISPTELVFRPPLSVVTPKDVVPPETVVRLTAVPPTMRSPEAETEALPVAAMSASRLPVASTETLAPANEVAPKKELFGSVSVMLPVVEVIEDGAPVTIGPVWVMAPTAEVVRPPVSVVAPKVVEPPERVMRSTAVPAIERLPLVATETSAPLTVTRPRRSLPALLRVMSAGTPPWVAVAEVVP